MSENELFKLTTTKTTTTTNAYLLMQILPKPQTLISSFFSCHYCDHYRHQRLLCISQLLFNLAKRKIKLKQFVFIYLSVLSNDIYYVTNTCIHFNTRTEKKKKMKMKKNKNEHRSRSVIRYVTTIYIYIYVRVNLKFALVVM